MLLKLMKMTIHDYFIYKNVKTFFKNFFKCKFKILKKGRGYRGTYGSPTYNIKIIIINMHIIII
jgi:hypothetical protein